VRTITSKAFSAAFALGAAASSVGLVATLPAECGSKANDLPLVLMIAAGCSLAAAFVFIGRRTSIWLWVGAVVGGALLSAVLFVADFISWAETCMN
jgi:hypothetical protein